MASDQPVLSARNLHGWYGESHVLQGIDFEVGAGEIVTLLGRNGAGKTTTLRAIMGLLERCTGEISFRGRAIHRMAPEEVAMQGIAYCPEERGIFSRLTVRENLFLAPIVQPGGMPLARIYELFPNLQSRLRNPGTKLSGGEQQMLAIARILRTGARMLLLDEPTEGLAPVIVKQIGRVLKALKAEGYTVMLVEQNLSFVGRLADRHYVIEGGRTVESLSRHDLAGRRTEIQAYLGV